MIGGKRDWLWYGIDSELLIFSGVNHWILKPGNVVAWYKAVFEFSPRHTS